jgi:sterol desaturase/sphingolipid hydroxylase (fatty acid hydroxylase superfamily)
MPTPFEILADPITLGLFAAYAGLMLWEAVLPARRLPQVPGWKLRTGISFVAYFLLSSYLPLLWDERLAAFRLFDLSALGSIGGALAGLLVYETGAYGWHRAMHASDLLWRVFHQMHHSAERLDTWSTFWFSPADMVGWTLLGSLSLVLVVGITPEAATAALLTISFLAMFQHANVRTPRWLGLIVQRPEQHRVHHGRGIHGYNYSDLPLIDALFGTLRNPTDFDAPSGFWQGASSRVKDMLSGRDLSRSPQAVPHIPLQTLGYADK